MTRSNKEVVNRFVNGCESGQANRLQILTGPMEYDGQRVATEDETILVGHGWAVLARRTPNGRINIFNGWQNYSNTTARHISLIEHAAPPNAILKGKRLQMQPEP